MRVVEITRAVEMEVLHNHCHWHSHRHSHRTAATMSPTATCRRPAHRTLLGGLIARCCGRERVMATASVGRQRIPARNHAAVDAMQARPANIKKNVDDGSSGALRTPPPTGQTLESVRLSVGRQQPGYLLKWIVIACCASLVVITARLERTGGREIRGTRNRDPAGQTRLDMTW